MAAFDTYLSLAGGCTAGDLLFSNFQAVFNSRESATAASIQVTPATLPDVALLFTADFATNQPGFAFVALSYSVTDVGVASQLGALSLSVTRELTGANAFAGVGQRGFIGLTPYLLRGPAGPNNTSPQQITGFGINSVTVRDLVYSTRLKGGSAGVKSFQNTFVESSVEKVSQTPEPSPATLTLTAMALLLAGAWRRRRVN